MTCHARDGSALEYALKVMAEAAPRQVERAGTALNVLLRGLRNSCWPEVAWAFSELTPGGFPVELTFSSLPGSVVRYVLEVAGPEAPAHGRAAEAFRLYSLLAGRSASDAVGSALQAMQSGSDLAYGAWFGGAHTTRHDRYKIYAEIPRGLAFEECPLTAQLFPQGLPLSHRQAVPVMFGFQPDSEVRELYFRAAGLAAEDLGMLLWTQGMSHQYHPALELMRATCALPRPLAAMEGFSVAFDGEHRARAVALFAESAFLFGSDANVRRTLMALARSQGWDFTLYEKATQLLEGREDLVRHHGVLAWIISREAPIELRIGLRPPEPSGSG